MAYWSEGDALLTFESLDLLAEAPDKPLDDEWWFEASADDFSLGDPEREVTEIVSQLIEGSAVAFGETGNRTASFKVRAVSPTSRGLTLAEAELTRVCDTKGIRSLAYTHPDGTSPTTVFDVLLADLTFEFDDLDELRRTRTWTLTLTCKPWPRSGELVEIAARNTPGTQPPTPPADLVITDGTGPANFDMNQSSLTLNELGQMVAGPTTTEPTTKGRNTYDGDGGFNAPNEIGISPKWNPTGSAMWGRFCWGREVITPQFGVYRGLSAHQGEKNPRLWWVTNVDVGERTFLVIDGFVSGWAGNYNHTGNTALKAYGGLGTGSGPFYNHDLEFRVGGVTISPSKLTRDKSKGSFRAVLPISGGQISSIAVIASNNLTYDVVETFIAIDKITATAGAASTLDGRMQNRALSVVGAKPAEASLEIQGYNAAGVATPLGAQTLIYTSTADGGVFQPPLTAYRASGPLTTADATALSSSSNTMATTAGAADTYDIPIDLLTPGTYQILASLYSTTTGDRTINWSATLAGLDGTSTWPSVSGSAVVPLLSSADGKWRVVPIGEVTLPIVEPESAPAGMVVRLRAWAGSTNVLHDTLLLVNVSTGDLSIVDTSANGSLTVTGLRVDAPNSTRPVQTYWLEYGDGSIMNAGSRVTAPGVHHLNPGAMTAFTITTGNYYSTVTAAYYPRWSTYAAPIGDDEDTA